jgi:hypothetical protein
MVGVSGPSRDPGTTVCIVGVLLVSRKKGLEQTQALRDD